MKSNGGAPIRRALITAAILLAGAAIGVGTARVAESVVASHVTTEARRLDQLSTLAESAALVQAAVGHATLLSGTERPAALARAEAEAAAATFQAALEGLTDDPMLRDAGEWMLGTSDAVLDELDAGAPPGVLGAGAPALEVPYRNFSDLVAERRRNARAAVSAAAEVEEVATVALTALVVFLAPAAVVFLTVRLVRRSTESVVGSPMALEDPSAIIERRT